MSGSDGAGETASTDGDGPTASESQAVVPDGSTREGTDTAPETGSLTEGESGRMLTRTVALFAVAGGGYGVTSLGYSLLGPGSGFGPGVTGGGGAGVAAAMALSLGFSVAPLVALGTGAWIGHALDEGVTSTAMVGTAAGAAALIGIVFLFAMADVAILSSGQGTGGFGGPSVGDQVGPLVGVVVGTALTGTVAAEVVHDL